MRKGDKLSKDKHPKPEPDGNMNGEIRSIWRMLDWLGEEIRDGRKERRQFQAALFIAIIGAIVTVLVK